MYEATKRATQDITTHAKEAMQRTGLKDVSEGVSGGQGLRAVGCRGLGLFLEARTRSTERA